MCSLGKLINKITCLFRQGKEKIIMAFDVNDLLEKVHVFAKPYIVDGMKKGIVKIDETLAKTGTVADNLLWEDLKESFQKPCPPA
jgi:hypothetical protein